MEDRKIKIANRADTLKVLGNALRLKILLAIHLKKCKVTGIVNCLNEPQPIISQQIAVLRRANIIKGERTKNMIIYNITNPFVKMIISEITTEESITDNFFHKSDI